MVKETRYHKLNKVDYTGGSILYWMNRDMRLEDNWALLYANELSKEYKVPLYIAYNLDPNFLGGSSRSFDFKISILEEIAKTCDEKNIPFTVLVGSDTEKQLVSFVKDEGVGFLVTDFSPLTIQRSWLEKIVSNISIPAVRVDAHNIVPAWIASTKQEVGARTLRPKLHKLLPEYIESFPPLKISNPSTKKFSIDWDLIKSFRPKDAVPTLPIQATKSSAHTTLERFIKNKLNTYPDKRNDPCEDAQSDLSPFLHYGVIAPARVVLTVCHYLKKEITDILPAQKNASKIDLNRNPSLLESASAFFEELIVRRELSDNFCFYNPHYDSVLGFAPWAQETLKKHKSDKREYVYTQEQFEQAQTHDDLWNAAQREMVQTGKMHGYMRMYWAKKILEWSKSPEEAMATAIYLNDRYELDGRDPNGYTGIAWSIGGVHDRPWFDRPIFGLIRYMARSGCEKKFNTAAYIERWGR